MKIKPLHIFFFLAFIFTVSASAQVNRSIAPQQYKRAKSDKKKTDFVGRSVDYLTKELKLDDFQSAAVKNILEEERNNITAVSETKGITYDERRDMAIDVSNRIYKKVLPLLSKEQAEIYTKMEESKKF